MTEYNNEFQRLADWLHLEFDTHNDMRSTDGRAKIVYESERSDDDNHVTIYADVYQYGFDHRRRPKLKLNVDGRSPSYRIEVNHEASRSAEVVSDPHRKAKRGTQTIGDLVSFEWIEKPCERSDDNAEDN